MAVSYTRLDVYKRQVLLSSVRVSRVPTYSGSPRPLNNFAYGPVTLFRCAFQHYSAIVLRAFRGPYPAHIAICGLGFSDFARHYFRNRFYFLFLRVLRCFSSPGSPHTPVSYTHLLPRTVPGSSKSDTPFRLLPLRFRPRDLLRFNASVIFFPDCRELPCYEIRLQKSISPFCVFIIPHIQNLSIGYLKIFIIFCELQKFGIVIFDITV